MTPAPESGPGDQFEHPALFYSSREEYLAATIPFIEGALTAGEPVTVAVPEPDLDAVRRALSDAAERVLLVDMAEVGANPGRIIPALLRDFADAHPDRRVRIIGESTWPGRTRLEYPACVQHEALINLAFAGRAATIMCAYDAERLSQRAIADARAAHTSLIDRTGHRPSDQYHPTRLLAETNRPLDRPPWSAIERAVDPASIDNARWFATAYGQKTGLTPSQLVDLEIALTELLTNSIVHGGGTGVYRIWSDEEHLICEVSDAGRITDPLVGRRPAGEPPHHGRGLLLVNQIVDLVRMHTDPNGTTVRIHLRLPDHDGPAGA